MAGGDAGGGRETGNQFAVAYFTFSTGDCSISGAGCEQTHVQHGASGARVDPGGDMHQYACKTLGAIAPLMYHQS